MWTHVKIFNDGDGIEGFGVFQLAYAICKTDNNKELVGSTWKRKEKKDVLKLNASWNIIRLEPF